MFEAKFVGFCSKKRSCKKSLGFPKKPPKLAFYLTKDSLQLHTANSCPTNTASVDTAVIISNSVLSSPGTRPLHCPLLATGHSQLRLATMPADCDTAPGKTCKRMKCQHGDICPVHCATCSVEQRTKRSRARVIGPRSARVHAKVLCGTLKSTRA